MHTIVNVFLPSEEKHLEGEFIPWDDLQELNHMLLKTMVLTWLTNSICRQWVGQVMLAMGPQYQAILHVRGSHIRTSLRNVKLYEKGEMSIFSPLQVLISDLG